MSSNVNMFGRYLPPGGGPEEYKQIRVDADGYLLGQPVLDIRKIIGPLGAGQSIADTLEEEWIVEPGIGRGLVQLTCTKYGEASEGESFEIDCAHPLEGGGWSEYLPLPLLARPSHPTAGVMQIVGLPAGGKFRIRYTNGATAQDNLQFIFFAFGG